MLVRAGEPPGTHGNGEDTEEALLGQQAGVPPLNSWGHMGLTSHYRERTLVPPWAGTALPGDSVVTCKDQTEPGDRAQAGRVLRDDPVTLLALAEGKGHGLGHLLPMTPNKAPSPLYTLACFSLQQKEEGQDNHPHPREIHWDRSGGMSWISCGDRKVLGNFPLWVFAPQMFTQPFCLTKCLRKAAR